MRNRTMVAGMAVMLAAAGCGKPAAPPPKAAGGAVLKAQEFCPVMGGKIDRNICAVHDGKCVYFCCQDCVAKFKEDPAQYVKKLEAQGVTLQRSCACGKREGQGTCCGRCPAHSQAKAQRTCPVTGAAVSSGNYVDYEGKRIYFCCESCIATFEKDPAKYLQVLAAKGEVPAAIPTTE